jgi:hypothetical protein
MALKACVGLVSECPMQLWRDGQGHDERRMSMVCLRRFYHTKKPVCPTCKPGKICSSARSRGREAAQRLHIGLASRPSTSPATHRQHRPSLGEWRRRARARTRGPAAAPHTAGGAAAQNRPGLAPAPTPCHWAVRVAQPRPARAAPWRWMNDGSIQSASDSGPRPIGLALRPAEPLPALVLQYSQLASLSCQSGSITSPS